MSRIDTDTSSTDGISLDKKFERVLSRYRSQPGALITLLQEAQALYSYLPKPVIRRIARAFGRSPAQVYGVASFYQQFRLAPLGRYTIRVCYGTACHVRGARAILEKVEEMLCVKAGGTTPDGKFTLEAVNCLGACALGPLITIHGKYYGKITPSRLEAVMEEYGVNV